MTREISDQPAAVDPQERLCETGATDVYRTARLSYAAVRQPHSWRW